ncbi:MATE family efflux transporter [Propionimicrobium sp. PCR01-08-3]|uniref:MATE family efflux transporter n=1 Tax=Propionimicrobium sp. PCR01-08-3 TaxID=3052086 RepID=UPI00255CF3DE|nr:MATE family efflux transporter [Propionimicrobium sp. PCR01-08-3]WIY84151.1 MATE family efflux transporter [Propionimicrobium sp. PCR01-08-3]
MDRRMGALAIPALGALIAEPVFVLTDTAMVGHLGATVLGGMSVGSTVMQTVIGLCIFLSYVTTPLVARRLGAGDKPGAIRAGIEGMWTGLGLGVLLLVIGLPVAAPLTTAFTPDAAVAEQAFRYIAICVWGLPGMLLVLAATGLLRGLQDTRTPLLVATAGAVVNVALNWLFIYPAGMGIAGSALGTAITQTLMAAAYIRVAVRAAHEHRVSLSPGVGNRWQALAASSLMLLRTLTLRIVLVVLVWAAARLGTLELAALQVTMSLYNLLVNAMDALAIAAQAMIGHDLGAGDSLGVRRQLNRIVGWGAVVGLVLAVLVAAISPVVGAAFTSDEAVRGLLPASFIMMACFLPMCGVLFVLDGVLIGAGDIRYLAIAGLWPMLSFCALIALVLWIQPTAAMAMIWLWISYFGAFMCVRLLVLVLRARTNSWLVTGHDR